MLGLQFGCRFFGDNFDCLSLLPRVHDELSHERQVSVFPPLYVACGLCQVSSALKKKKNYQGPQHIIYF